MNELRGYYQNLYCNEDSDLSEELCLDFLDDNYIQKLSENSRMGCEGKLSCAECYDTLFKFQNGKAPGNDGLTVDFYKGFWDL